MEADLRNAPDSVFLNFQLVNVLWPTSSTPVGSGTVLETYVQQTGNCLSCHTMAPIPGDTSPPVYASDYSLLFSRAATSSGSGGSATGLIVGGGAALLAAAAAGAWAVRRRR